eukprot:762856-Hanusia_phi.AAC.2
MKEEIFYSNQDDDFDVQSFFADDTDVRGNTCNPGNCKEQTSTDPTVALQSQSSIRVKRKKIGGQENKTIFISYDILTKHFHESIQDAASKLGIGKSTMKLVCRKLGLEKWPFTSKGKKRTKRQELPTFESFNSESAYNSRSFLSNHSKQAQMIQTNQQDPPGSTANETQTSCLVLSSLRRGAATHPDAAGVGSPVSEGLFESVSAPRRLLTVVGLRGSDSSRECTVPRYHRTVVRYAAGLASGPRTCPGRAGPDSSWHDFSHSDSDD